MIKNMAKLLRSGKVKRWHNNPDMNHSGENLAEHQWLTAAFVIWLKPDASADLIKTALFHDVGELGAGDLSFDFKRASPKLAEQHARVETQFRNEIVGALSGEQHDLLKLADWLAAWDIMCHHRPQLRRRGDWKAQVKQMVTVADNISVDCGNRVEALIYDRYVELRDGY